MKGNSQASTHIIFKISLRKEEKGVKAVVLILFLIIFLYSLLFHQWVAAPMHCLGIDLLISLAFYFIINEITVSQILLGFHPLLLFC